jgi:exopolysaccharide biosynthesis polyprenyl glycosylphosphotransferase
MFKETARRGDALLRLADLVALSIAVPIIVLIHGLLPGGSAIVDASLASYAPTFLLTILLWIASAWLNQVYEARARSSILELGRVTHAIGLVALIVSAAAFFTGEPAASRMAVLAYFAIAWVLLVGIRFSIRATLRSLGRSGRRVRYYAVVGSDDLATDIVETIGAEELGFKLAGYVLEDGRSPSNPDCVILGTVSQLARVLEEHVLDEIVFAVPRERLSAMEDAILTCQEQGVSVRISLDVLRVGHARMSVGEIAGLPMLALTRTPSDKLALAAKRAFDVLVSAAVLVVLSPLLIGVAIAIRVDSRGPIFFRQRRVGLSGRTFDILKFRSMYVDAEERLEALRAHNEMSGPVFKMTNDPRVTPVGRFIRRMSLDEFPQFWNVLHGDMSVVGPRPPLPSEVRQYKRWQRRRLSVKPGITCIWQISGRNDIDFERWMELDLEYIDRWSLWGDIQICLKTIPAVLGARGVR